MPRIRSIKPEFWGSFQVMECSRNARLMFIGLWNFCDDAGRMPIRPKEIRARLFPGDDDITSETILGMLRELYEQGLIVTYHDEKQWFLHVTGWHHQRIDKAQKPRYPDPEKNVLQEYSWNDPGSFPPDRIGKDRIGEKVPRAKALGQSDPASDPDAVADPPAAAFGDLGLGEPDPPPDPPPPSHPPPNDPKAQLFSIGLQALERLGVAEAKARPVIGRMLKNHDPPAVLDAILKAERHNAADPIPYIQRVLKPPAQSPAAMMI